MKKSFIKTKDKDAAQYLLSQGYTLLEENGKEWIFINDRTIDFSNNEDKKELSTKLIFTNMLNV